MLTLLISWAMALETSFINESYLNYVELHQRSSAESVEELLAELKEQSPDYFQSYLLGYRSRSLQNSSPLSPRVILFSPKADMAIAFNGAPEHRGFHNIENMAFNYDTDRFEFFESSFSDDQKPAMGAINPKKCLECHQSTQRTDVDPRPNWEPYNKWPGFYGSKDDEISGYFFTEEHLLRDFPLPEDRIIVDETLAEKQNFDLFEQKRLAGPAQEPRYGLLDTIVNNVYKTDHFVNTPFTKKLSILNFRRVARLMTQDKEVYEFVKWNIVASKKCSSIQIAKDVHEFLVTKTSGPFTRYFGHSSSYTFSDMVALFFEPFGIDTTDWSMDFKTNGRMAFAERFGTPNAPWIEFTQGFEKYFLSDPDFLNLNCSQITEEAKKRFGNLEAVKAFYEKRKLQNNNPPSRPLIQRCISCHSDGSTQRIPYIPFDNAKELAKALDKPGYKRGSLKEEILFRTGPHAPSTEQMPPSGVPSVAQKKEFLEYINSL